MYKIMVIHIRNRLFNSNTYLLKNLINNNCIVIDPGLDSDNIVKIINENKLNPVGILCTHGHFDHIASVSNLKKVFGHIPYYLHKADLKIAKSANFYLKLTKINYWIEHVEPDYVFEKEIEELEIDEFIFTVYHFPGHSNGSCIFKFNNSLFTGDIIYKQGLGFNKFPGENINVLKETIKKIILSFDNKHSVYPGHGEIGILGDFYSENSELINFINN
jgi:glyoxylase-like metal-dependent hydrolase (beta-lactamase superfamily II)